MAKQKPQNPTPDVAEMFQLAEQYSVTSNRLVEQSRGTAKYAGAPYLMIDSFAVELYLKCLVTQDTNKPAQWSHNHRELFDTLNPATQEEIRKAFQRVIDGDVILKNLPAINLEAVKVLDFDRSLMAASNTFDKRRYAYDPPPSSEWYYAHLLRLAVRDVAKVDLRVGRYALPEAGQPAKTVSHDSGAEGRAERGIGK